MLRLAITRLDSSKNTIPFFSGAIFSVHLRVKQIEANPLLKHPGSFASTAGWLSFKHLCSPRHRTTLTTAVEGFQRSYILTFILFFIDIVRTQNYNESFLSFTIRKTYSDNQGALIRVKDGVVRARQLAPKSRKHQTGQTKKPPQGLRRSISCSPQKIQTCIESRKHREIQDWCQAC